jgi:hypothetical protein
VVQPVSTFIMEVLPWAASGAIGVYLLWVACLAPEQTSTPAPEHSGPAASSQLPAEQASATRRTWGIAALPELAGADQSANAM